MTGFFHALTRVSADVEADCGMYVEPNVWVDHRLSTDLKTS